MAVAKSAPKADVKEDLLPIGTITSLVSGGRTLEGYEVVAKDEKFIKFRANLQIAPMTEYVLVPYAKLEMVGVKRV